MAKNTVTMHSGTDFMTVRVEVTGRCDHAEQAVRTGISEAMHKMGHMMPKLSVLATRIGSKGNSISEATCQSTSDGVTCTVRVSGRAKGVPSLIVNDMLGRSAQKIHSIMSKDACDLNNEVITDIVKGFGDDLSEPYKIIGYSEGTVSDSREAFAGVGYGPMPNGHGPWS